jgi:hypothetical protein
MIEAIVVLLIVVFAALHVAFKLSPIPVQQKLYNAYVMGFNKVGLHAVAQRLSLKPQNENKACDSGCDGCGTQTVAESKVEVVQFHPRLR